LNTDGMRQIFCIFAFLLASVTAYGQADSQTFVKITHSVDLTVAVDSTGKEWIFDRDRGQFVESSGYERFAPDSRGLSDEDYSQGDIILPPEVRCTDIIDHDLSELLKPIEVGIDQRIEGNVFSGQDVVVKGLVTGDVVSLKTVTVESTGEVRGDVVAKEIRRDRGGQILGRKTNIPVPALPRIEIPRYIAMPDVWSLFISGFLVFICLIGLALVPKPVKNVVQRIDHEVIRSFFYGLLGWFALAPVFVLLIITVVGIPIALLVYPLFILAAVVLAFVSMAVFIGQRVAPALGLKDKSLYLKGLIGVVAVEMINIIGVFFGAVGLTALNSLLFVLYVIAASVALTIGFGAVLSSRFGSRPFAWRRDAGLRPPAPPVAPPISPPPSPLTPPPPPSAPPSSDEKNATD